MLVNSKLNIAPWLSDIVISSKGSEGESKITLEQAINVSVIARSVIDQSSKVLEDMEAALKDCKEVVPLSDANIKEILAAFNRNYARPGNVQERSERAPAPQNSATKAQESAVECVDLMKSEGSAATDASEARVTVEDAAQSNSVGEPAPEMETLLKEIQGAVANNDGRPQTESSINQFNAILTQLIYTLASIPEDAASEGQDEMSQARVVYTSDTSRRLASELEVNVPRTVDLAKTIIFIASNTKEDLRPYVERLSKSVTELDQLAECKKQLAEVPRHGVRINPRLKALGCRVDPYRDTFSFDPHSGLPR